MASEDDFSAFLNKMSGQTGNRKRPAPKPVVEERQPPKKPAPVSRRREEDDYAELPQRRKEDLVKMKKRDENLNRLSTKNSLIRLMIMRRVLSRLFVTTSKQQKKE